ncbi:MAG: GLE1-like protein-domain-containing protein [Benjaminiella poitrasii]|nr:MAG: GLE1-like protein-domain-containing protein [Benjaminiella poitrasii]
MMKPDRITNNIVYTVPDLDSDSDSEDSLDAFDYTPKPSEISDRQKCSLIRLGCMYNALDEYRRSVYSQNPKSYDQQFEANLQEHLQQLQKEKESLIKSQREQKEAELQKLKSILSELNISSHDNDTDEDKAFEEELKKQRKLIDDAIAADKKRLETAAAEAKAKAEKEKKEKEEMEKKDKAEKEKKEAMAKQQQSAATSIEGMEEYKKFYAKIEYYKEKIKPKLKEDAFRKQCFNAKMAINRTVTQLQSDHKIVYEKYEFLKNHILGIKQQSNEAFEYMLNHLSKVFLAQVKQEIHATAFAAYFLARFAYLMCSAIPEFLDYLMGRLIKRCQYLIPKYHDDDPSLAADEIRSRLRYNYANKEKKILESFLEHAENQRCYVMFYGALCQTMPDPGQPANPFPIKHAWIWLARVCNMPPREVTPILVLGFLEITTVRLLEAYPNQTRKLLHLIHEAIGPMYPVTDNQDNLSSIKQLEMFLDNYFQTGIPKCIPETLPPSVK